MSNQLQNNWAILRYVILLFVAWRVVLLFIAFIGLGALPNTNHYTHQLFFPQPNLEYWIRWANWDGHAYQDIANKGYYSPILTVFFPAYPILIKVLTLTGLTSFLAGFLISQVSTIIALFFLYKLARLDFTDKVAQRAIFALLIFPTSFYLVSVYNESLILAATTAAFYFARKKRWFIGAVLATLASATRLTGLAVVAAVIIEYLFNNQIRLKLSWLWETKLHRFFIYSIVVWLTLDSVKINFITNQKFLVLGGSIVTVLELLRWIIIILGIIMVFELFKLSFGQINFKKVFSLQFAYFVLAFLPFIIFAYFQQTTFHSPLTFVSQEIFWGKALSPPWQGPLFNIQYLISNFLSIGEYSARVHLRLLIFSVSLICLILSFARLRLSYIIFSIIVLVIPLFSGTLIDFPRYALMNFPLFLILGMIRNEILEKTLIIFSTLMLAILTVLYFNSYFFM